MTIGLLGKKIGMTQIFNPEGKAIPVTILELGPCTITDIKNKKSHGYEAIQIGYLNVSIKKLSKAQIGNFKKWQIAPLKYLKEYKIHSSQNFKIGQNITINDLSINQKISVSGISIGKGFTGYQKRHHFSRGPMSHGSKNHRQPGSIGAGTTPGRVFLGKRMAGRMGSKQVTIKNIHILDINTENNTIAIKGCVPGKSGNIVSIYQK
uniref:Large ribosomal subunit protein uL3c n=1 Tax=Gracilariopsis heteroclada TaxID=172978 RepID=A0A344V6L7_9FLOR|nr:ribosomal protein L3 [Gracilariopsis heteroclada]AXE43604.1 ribosomal protein L3 [Gracilariopsis heteroclada]